MELQFQKITIPCLSRLDAPVQEQEQTQEVRLNESMPDIGRVLSAWGQVVIRGKEWRGDTMSVNGGCMVWILYAPEDGSPVQSVETWIPFHIKWDAPETDRDGMFVTEPLLCSVDARAVSSRKLLARVCVSASAEAYTREDGIYYVPDALPEDIQLKTSTYPLFYAKEAAEKPFALEEKLNLPQSAQPLEKLIYCMLLPEVTETRVMSDKLIFRGTAKLNVFYRGQDGDLHNHSFELPFSQFTELEHEYGQDAQARVCVAVTNLELDPETDGSLQLRAGMTGQYVLSERQMVTLTQDAYSVLRPVTLTTQQLGLPAILEETEVTVYPENTLQQDVMQVKDVAFYPEHPVVYRRGDQLNVDYTGTFAAVYCDAEGALQATEVRWNDTQTLPAAENTDSKVRFRCTEKPQFVMTGDGVTLKAAGILSSTVTAKDQLPMVTALTVGESVQPDPNRPSLILRRMGKNSLWEVAKQCTSTVDAIRKANNLQEEPAPDQMLLIPVL